MLLFNQVGTRRAGSEFPPTAPGEALQHTGRRGAWDLASLDRNHVQERGRAFGVNDIQLVLVARLSEGRTGAAGSLPGARGTRTGSAPSQND